MKIFPKRFNWQYFQNVLIKGTSLTKCDQCIRIIRLFHFSGYVDVWTGDKVHLVLTIVNVVKKCFVCRYQQRVLLFWANGTFLYFYGSWTDLSNLVILFFDRVIKLHLNKGRIFHPQKDKVTFLNNCIDILWSDD